MHTSCYKRNPKAKTEVKAKIPGERLPTKLLTYQKTDFLTLETSPSTLMVVGSEKDNRESIKDGESNRRLTCKLNSTS